MNNVIFENKGEIDIRAITTFGVSSKENDNPIGFFGTGLKYAIAIFLRLGQEVTIFSGLERYDFATEQHSIRVDTFDIVTMNGTPLAFTTELGKNWDLWQAFRELYCNCQDERGLVALGNWPKPREGSTIVVVSGQKVTDQYERIDEIILKTNYVAGNETLELHKGAGKYLYYQGIRVYDMPRKAMFNYNFIKNLTLTEDRTVKELWSVHNKISRYIVCDLDDKKLLTDILTVPEEYYEANADFNWTVSPSDLFLDTMGDLLAKDPNSITNDSLKRVYQTHTKKDLVIVTKQPNDLETKRLEKAVTFCKQLGYKVDRYPINLSENLGKGLLGRAHSGEIYISTRCMMMGTKMVAGTMIEEFLHLDQHLIDYTAEMQNYLFDQMVTMGEQIIGEPL